MAVLVSLHCMQAVSAGHSRFITTGPHWALFGPEEALAFNFMGGGSLRPYAINTLSY